MPAVRNATTPRACHGVFVGAMPEVTLAVDGMTCGHCSSRVEKTLRLVPGVVSARVDLAANLAFVEGTAAAAALM